MKDVNGWLMALAFLLGLVLTFAMMIRRVTREVPVTLSASAGVLGDIKAPDLGKVAGTVTAAGAAVASGAAAKISGAADKVGDLVEHAADAVGDKVGAAADAVGDKVGAAADAVGDKVGAAADAVGDKVEAILEREPHGAGSVRLAARKDAPAGYSVKFDPESRQYLLPGAAGYEEVETEWWFADEASAKAAGFSRWDDLKGKFGDFVGRAGAKVGAAADAMGDKIGAAADAVGDKVGAAADAVGDKVDEAGAAAAGFVAAAKMSIDDVPAGPYGKGSFKALSDGSGPEGWLIKGNADSMLYHPPDSPAYEQTIAEFWFFDEESARAAGFDKWDKNFR